jgi:hypothetical protein
LFQNKKEVGEIERKTAALTLVLLTAFAALIGGLAATTLAAGTNSTTTETSTAATSEPSSNATDLPFWGMGGMMMSDQGFGGGPGFRGGHRGCGPGFMGGMGNIEVSSEYTATVNAILNNDTDVQNLITQGYNVTSINPIVKNVIGADGTVTTKATTAIVTLQNGTSGYAVASVDISQAKVTQIVIFTRTVIDKTTG